MTPLSSQAIELSHIIPSNYNATAADNTISHQNKEKETLSIGCGGWLTTCLERRGIPTLTPVASGEVRHTIRAKHGLRGVINMGNTCFLSCVIQVLAHLAPVQAYFLYGYAKQTAEQKHNTEAHLQLSMSDQDMFCLACEMANIFAAMFADDSCEALVPHRLLYATWRYADSFAGYEQQDAHEFLMVLLDALAKHTAIGNTNVINEIFRGELGSHLECHNCAHKKQSVEPFHDLSLALRGITILPHYNNTAPNMSELTTTPLSASSSQNMHTLSEISGKKLRVSPDNNQVELLLERGTSINDEPALKKQKSEPHLLRSASHKNLKLDDLLGGFTCPEVLSDGHICENCGVSANRKKRLSIAKLPNVLVIHLKRFDALRSTKITDGVDFPTELDLTSRLLDHHSTIDQKYIYHLAGVVNHVGDLNRGHYTCFFKEGGRWFSNDDTLIEEVDVDTVKKSEGYILFYVRTEFATLLDDDQDAQVQANGQNKTVIFHPSAARAASPALSSTSNNSSHPSRLAPNNSDDAIFARGQTHNATSK
eukprot:CAMPEP_0197319342 /NCGR_PEP_ID=MMETSP0891-20130614/54411_1 /TAXON_ID=44058 ORGANISM="Aureoumbra lagunensis, Strain CCMP1510" /NCGR_SAMPLE_ID=MMETSP0891 /ASSEMBLY_ACC=CAM_ASM_000534 /LENGTH=537 /DNA_ID=CAMNT_0042810227 /DNA_START=354 /DNA_END=1967 /DNA_ORIENTATION=+